MITTDFGHRAVQKWNRSPKIRFVSNIMVIGGSGIALALYKDQLVPETKLPMDWLRPYVRSFIRFQRVRWFLFTKICLVSSRLELYRHGNMLSIWNIS